MEQMISKKRERGKKDWYVHAWGGGGGNCTVACVRSALERGKK